MALLTTLTLQAAENQPTERKNVTGNSIESRSVARIPDVKFRRLDTADGLSNSQVNCIFRDSRGFIWVGTAYGLNRYDGYRFKTFYSNRLDSTSMRDNYTQLYP